MKRAEPLCEWPTLALIFACYAIWAMALFLPLALAIPVVALSAALHASLSHEALHGHPTRWSVLNAALVFPVLSLTVPYLRFKDTHLDHHRDSRLTDPYEDPESNFLDPARWPQMAAWQRKVFELHNTLAGRMLLGPILGQLRFMWSDLKAMARGNMRVALGWTLHVPSVALVLWCVAQSPMPIGAYLFAAYLANAILRIRTFLEHRAHEKSRARTVIIEDRGLLAFLFLNNNFHAVHHMHPRAPWYDLPALYAARKARYLACNEGYHYPSYREIFARFLTRAKDPVPHPLYEDWTRRS